MKAGSPTLLPLLRTRVQGEILAFVLLRPGQDHSLTEIAAGVGTSLPTAKREIDRLQAAGLVASTARGNTRLVRVREDNPVYKPLADLLAVTFGPLPVLRDSLADVPGIERAFIYGSWAARYVGEAGDVPRDVDVLVVGTPDRAALRDATDAAEKRLRREVNVRVVDADTWDGPTGDSAFRRTLESRPVVALLGGHVDLAQA